MVSYHLLITWHKQEPPRFALWQHYDLCRRKKMAAVLLKLIKITVFTGKGGAEELAVEGWREQATGELAGVVGVGGPSVGGN